MNSASIPKPTGCKPVPLSRRWLRRLLWTCVCLISLLVLYYQWENRRGAHELTIMRKQLIERLGTDDPLAFSPPKIRDDEKLLRHRRRRGMGHRAAGAGKRLQTVSHPGGCLLAEGRAEARTHRKTRWKAPRRSIGSNGPLGRDLKGESPAAALNRELGDLNGLLSKLAEGLDRPFACIKPGLREAQEAAKGEIWNTAIPKTGLHQLPTACSRSSPPLRRHGR